MRTTTSLTSGGGAVTTARRPPISFKTLKRTFIVIFRPSEWSTTVYESYSYLVVDNGNESIPSLGVDRVYQLICLLPLIKLVFKC